ncbi:MAG: sodium:proton antiporter NhaD [Bacteroidota bacterium]|nr:sodium:proton antiporter NhaD [Bacteroidota bacterium]
MGTVILIIFVAGYIAIATEHSIKINKAATALLIGVLCWAVYVLSSADTASAMHQLMEHLSEISGIVFFLMGAMVIVELIDIHDGFEILTQKISTTRKLKLLWIISFTTFFLSAVLDNLTTTIVIISLLRKLLSDRKDRLFFAGIVIIAANAGGAWSPLGDVTTTMLWIGGQITAGNIIAELILPSIVCLVVPLVYLSFKMKGNVKPPEEKIKSSQPVASAIERNTVFAVGIGALLFVPVFKTITHLPPFMGVLFGLSVLWIVTELMHGGKDHESKNFYSVTHALRKIDTSSILFFLGILICVSALQSTGLLTNFANWLTKTIANDTIIVMSIGLLSSIVDNVPLVAATQGMYSLAQYPTDHFFWEFLAYCTGTGGSALIIGSAAGVAAMGMEKIEFFWYLKRISLLALAGYIAGAVCYIIQNQLLH